MNNDQAKKDEERLDSFLNLLFGIDSGAMVFFLVVKGDKLGAAQLPFQLAFFPFMLPVLILAVCVLCILVMRGLNLFFHNKSFFRQLSKWLAMLFLILSVIAMFLGGWTLLRNPDFLPDGSK